MPFMSLKCDYFSCKVWNVLRQCKLTLLSRCPREHIHNGSEGVFWYVMLCSLLKIRQHCLHLEGQNKSNLQLISII
jgi:hypothetical protein